MFPTEVVINLDSKVCSTEAQGIGLYKMETLEKWYEKGVIAYVTLLVCDRGEELGLQG